MKAKRLRVVFVLCCLVGAFCSTKASATVFGFNYWPAGYSCNILEAANWTTENKKIVEQDLNVMASMDTGCIRIMFWPQLSGFDTYGGGNGGGFSNLFDEQKANLPEFVQMCKDRDIKVIIAFGNNYFSSGDGTTGHRW